MRDPATLALFVLFAAVIAGRMVHERGMRSLTPEEMARYSTAFSSYRKYSLLPLLVVVLVLFALPGVFPTWALFSALAAYVVVLSLLSFRKMSAIALPGSYVRTYAASQLLQIGGLIAYFMIVQR